MKRPEKYIIERQRPRGILYEVSFKYKDAQGHRNAFSRSFPSWEYSSPAAALKAACACRDEARAQMLTGSLPTRDRTTVSQAFDLAMDLDNLAPETLRQYKIIFGECIEPSLGSTPIGKLTTADIRKNMAANAKTKTRNTLRKLLILWRKIVAAALDADLIQKDIARTVKTPEAEVATKKIPAVMSCTLDDVLGAIAQYGTSNDKDDFNRRIMSGALTVTAVLGLRPAEAFAIEKTDIDLKHNTIRIGKRVGAGEDGSGRIVRPKTDQSERTLPFPVSLRPLLCELMDLQDSRYLFARWDGSLWDARSRSGYIKRACQKAGITFNAYQLRHQFSTDLVTAGVDLRTVQDLMGHASGSMTLGYARSNEDLMRKALEAREGKDLPKA